MMVAEKLGLEEDFSPEHLATIMYLLDGYQEKV
jgi:hypothetical protein